jgi:hypothetical protein
MPFLQRVQYLRKKVVLGVKTKSCDMNSAYRERLLQLQLGVLY